MYKYIFFAILIVAFVFNFKVKAITEFIIKKEINEKQEITAKLIAYVIAIACVICIMVL